jgi:hypothetical protein
MGMLHMKGSVRIANLSDGVLGEGFGQGFGRGGKRSNIALMFGFGVYVTCLISAMQRLVRPALMGLPALTIT